MLKRQSLMLSALWWGSATAVGFWVVPLLFVNLAVPAMAGQMAAKLFTAQTWVALVCGVLMLLIDRRVAHDQWTSQSDANISVEDDTAEISLFKWSPSPWLIAGMFLALLIEVAIKPHILAHDNMMLWHNLGSACYLGQWWCAGVLLWRMSRTSLVA
jgi:hypothetical protein